MIADLIVGYYYKESKMLHAEWLFDKGKYMESAEAFCHTVDHVEPSLVIAKFLSCQKFDAVILYIKVRNIIFLMEHVLSSISTTFM